MGFCSMMLHGDIPAEVRPLFFGTSLLTLQDVGWSLAHCCGMYAASFGCEDCEQARLVRDEMASLLAPQQLGFGTQGGAEAAVHAASRFLSRCLWIMQL